MQAAIISAVGRSETQEAVSLVKKAASHKDEQVRVAAIRSLGQTRPPEAFELLSAGLEDESTSVKMASIAGLGLVDDPRVLDLLVGIANDGEEPRNLRALALSSISKKDAPRADSAILIRLLADRDRNVRRAAAQTLGLGKHEPAIGPLIELLRDRDRAITYSACLALRRITGQTFKHTEVEKWKMWWRIQEENRAAQ